jgi:hypothetical protein
MMKIKRRSQVETLITNEEHELLTGIDKETNIYAGVGYLGNQGCLVVSERLKRVWLLYFVIGTVQRREIKESLFKSLLDKNLLTDKGTDGDFTYYTANPKTTGIRTKFYGKRFCAHVNTEMFEM